MPILHRTYALTALLPRYVSRFSCIGSACEDTCCAGWNVTLDKKTFNAYRQSAHPEMRKALADSIRRQQGDTNNLNYGVIALKQDTEACPLMNDGLCNVQNKMGESFLSHTCFSYPRLSRRFAGQYEQALQLSCPEAARQALLAPDAFEFLEGKITVRSESVAAVGAKHGLPLELMNELRIFCLNLMRAEGILLWQRLALLGVFCESLTATFASGDPDAVPALMKNFTSLLEQGQALDALDAVQPDHAAQALVFSILWGGKTLVTASALRNRIMGMVTTGLGFDAATGAVSNERLIECYRRGLSRLPEALEAAPYLLEHYILNEMFGPLFPFDGDTPYDSYLQLIARFGVLRLMLAAQCNTEGALPDATLLVHTVQTHCRRFDHDRRYTHLVNNSLKNSGRGTLEKIYPILRT